MNLATRFKIIGIEVLGLALFIFLLLCLEIWEGKGVALIGNFAWVFAIVAITLVLVGLETLSLAKKIQQ